MNEEVLMEIGLSKNEARVYLALIELGSSTVGNICERSKAHRTNCHYTLKRLIERGLVSYIIKNNIKYYEAVDPKILINILKEKEDKLKKILPQLKLQKQLISEKSEVKVYEGLQAAKNILNDLLEKKKTIMLVGNMDSFFKLTNIFLEQFHKKRVEKKILIRYICTANYKNFVNRLNSLKYTQVRTLSKYFRSPVLTIICRDEVILISCNENRLIIQIKNIGIANAYKDYFNILWNISKKQQKNLLCT